MIPPGPFLSEPAEIASIEGNENPQRTRGFMAMTTVRASLTWNLQFQVNDALERPVEAGGDEVLREI